MGFFFFFGRTAIHWSVNFGLKWCFLSIFGIKADIYMMTEPLNSNSFRIPVRNLSASMLLYFPWKRNALYHKHIYIDSGFYLLPIYTQSRNISTERSFSVHNVYGHLSRQMRWEEKRRVKEIYIYKRKKKKKQKQAFEIDTTRALFRHFPSVC